MFALPRPPVFLVSHCAAILDSSGTPATIIAVQCRYDVDPTYQTVQRVSSIKYNIYKFYIIILYHLINKESLTEARLYSRAIAVLALPDHNTKQIKEHEMTLSTLLYFLGASCVLIVAPGPDNLFVLSQGIAHGKRSAIVTALGMASGISVHTTAAACGISMLLYSSTAAFNLVRYAGAAYLFFLAWQSFKNQPKSQILTTENGNTFALFKKGFIMDVLNPKVTMFFLAFLPQFVSPTASHFALRIWLLGLLFMLQVAFILSLIGYFSGNVGRYIQERSGMIKPLRWLTTGVYTALGVRLALAER